MSKSPFSDLTPQLSAFGESMSGSTIRAQQALVTFLFSASQAQFGFSRGLAEDISDTFRSGPPANPAEALQQLVRRWHDRSENAIGEFRHLSDTLRSSLYDAAAQPLSKAADVLPEGDASTATPLPVVPPAQPLAASPLAAPPVAAPVLEGAVPARKR